MKKAFWTAAFLLLSLTIAGSAWAGPQIGVVPFEEKNAPGVSAKVLSVLTESFAESGFEVTNAEEMERAVKSLPGGMRIDAAAAQRLGNKTGCDWVVSGRVFGTAGKTFIVAKVLSTKTDEVTGEAQQVDRASELDAKLEELAARLVELIKAK